jgi:hypothetical protein
VLDPRRGPCLLFHAGVQHHEVFVRQTAYGQLLHRHLTAEHLIPGPPHGPHPTAAELLDEEIPAGQQSFCLPAHGAPEP